MRLLSPFGGRIKERGFELQQFLINPAAGIYKSSP
jgi:hypothetical protein